MSVLGNPTPVVLTDQNGNVLTGSASNASVGNTGVAAPTSATELGVIDNSGNLRGASSANPVRIDPTGTTVQPVSISSGGTTQYSDGTTQSTPTGTVALGKNGSSVLHAISLDSLGNLNVNVAAGGASGGTSSSFSSAFPATGTATGASDGTNMQPLKVDGSGNLKTVVNAALPAGTNVLGHVITDSGSTTAVTGNVTVTQGTGTNLHIVVDSAPTTAVTGTFFQATQPVSGTVTANAGTNLNTSALALETGGNLATIAGAVSASKVNVNISSGAIPAGTNLIGEVSASNETSTVYNGTTALTPLFANLTASASGASTLIALVSSKRIRVLALSLVANGAVNVKFQSHVTPTDISGLYYLAANGGMVLPYNPVGWFQTISGEALDINLSGAVAVGGSIVYVTV